MRSTMPQKARPKRMLVLCSVKGKTRGPSILAALENQRVTLSCNPILVPPNSKLSLLAQERGLERELGWISPNLPQSARRLRLV